MRKQLTKKDIEHLAKLSALTLTGMEKEKVTMQFSETLEYIGNLNELDSKDVGESDHLSQQENVFFEDGEEAARTLTQAEAVKNSKKHKNGLFIVGKVL